MYLLEYLKLKRVIMPNAGKDKKQLNLSYTTHGNVKLYNPLEKQYHSFLKS